MSTHTMRPDMGWRIPLETGGCISITSMDMETDTGTFKFYASDKEANDAEHAFSVGQFPEWHRDHCPRCKV